MLGGVLIWLAGLYWEVDNPSGLGVLASCLIVCLVLVPLCAVFAGASGLMARVHASASDIRPDNIL